MRLLNTATYEVKARNVPKYAILSHRWEEDEGEITYQMLSAANGLNPGLRNFMVDESRKVSWNKIMGTCAKGREQGYEWLWIDSLCINKADSVEMRESLNAMFDYYRDAGVCYSFLKDVDVTASREQIFQRQGCSETSEWFERGWTLQELLAPTSMEFYDGSWRFIGTRHDLRLELKRVTGIDTQYLNGDLKLREASIAERMSWMAGRVTGRVEDIAYSLLGMLPPFARQTLFLSQVLILLCCVGIFGVRMQADYGEGDEAFMRLQSILMDKSIDESIFAWEINANGIALECYRKKDRPAPKWKPDKMTWGLLAPSPDCFNSPMHKLFDDNQAVPRMGSGFTSTPQGVQIQMSFKSGSEMTNWAGLARKNIQLALNCWREDGSSNPPTILLDLTQDSGVYRRVRCDKLSEKKGAKPGHNRVLGIDQVLTRPLTVQQPRLPRGLK